MFPPTRANAAAAEVAFQALVAANPSATVVGERPAAAPRAAGGGPTGVSPAQPGERIVLLTDIGDDIDDTFAIAMLLAYLKRAGKQSSLAAIVATGRGHLAKRKELVVECLEFYDFKWNDGDLGWRAPGVGGGDGDGATVGAGGGGADGGAAVVQIFAGARHSPEMGANGVKPLAQSPCEKGAAESSRAAASVPQSPTTLIAYLRALQASTAHLCFINIGPSTTLGFLVRAGATGSGSGRHRLVMMAASYGIGYGARRGQSNEFNVRQDAPAFLDAVSAHWASPPTVVSLDTAGSILLRESEVAANTFLERQNETWRAGDLVASMRVSPARGAKHGAQRAKEKAHTCTSALYDCAAIYSWITSVEGSECPFEYSTSPVWVTDTGFTISTDFLGRGDGADSRACAAEAAAAATGGAASTAAIAAIGAAQRAAAVLCGSADEAGAVAECEAAIKARYATALDDALTSTTAVPGDAGGGEVIGVTPHPVAMTKAWRGGLVDVTFPMKPSYDDAPTRQPSEFCRFRARLVELISEC